MDENHQRPVALLDRMDVPARDRKQAVPASVDLVCVVHIAVYGVRDPTRCAAVAELKAPGVVFEDYDAPGLRTREGIADIEGNYPSKESTGERGATFRDSEANRLEIGQPVH